ncbi:MAG: GTPase domain-containing protein [Gammaproteobacteria bacterium]|nr:GTPase domain-containing protein [Gammaproteobacteria bacterium]
MADLDEQAHRLTLKLVYYGPALSGKTTNLVRLHDLLAPELKGEMMVLETKNDRTLFFDLLPLGLSAPSGLLIKLRLFTVPGQVAHDSTRKAVLSGADGVVFVADSQRNQAINNAGSFENLIDNIGRVGQDPATLPLVAQFNKRDLPEILSEQQIMEQWRGTPWPVLFACALQGRGVIETLAELLGRVYQAVDPRLALGKDHGLDQQQFITGLLGGSHGQ